MAAKSKEKKKGRRPVRQLIFRLVLLTVVVGVILAIGMVRHGWKPFGAKIPTVSSKPKPATPPAEDPTGQMTDKVKAVAEKLKETIAEAVNAPTENTPEPVTPTPTPKPKPASKKVSDEEKLKDFLDKQFQ
jgi:hypothetical protein